MSKRKPAAPNAAPSSTPDSSRDESVATESAGPKYLTEEQLHKRWGGAFARITLRIWRSKGTGPAWTKISRRALYPIEAVEAFEAEHRENLRARRETAASAKATAEQSASE